MTDEPTSGTSASSSESSATPPEEGFAVGELDAAERERNALGLTRRTNKDGDPVGPPLPTLDNVCKILEHDGAWAGVIGYNEFSGAIVRRAPLPGDDEPPGEWRDVDEIHTRRWISKTYGFEPKKDTVIDAVRLVANLNRFHPVREYLDTLRWDRRPRLRYWLGAYLGAVPLTPTDAPPAPANETGEDLLEEHRRLAEEVRQRRWRFDRYLHVVGVKWMVSAVARIMRPGVKADYVLILEGPQRRGKSSALEILAGSEWFLDTPFKIGTPDAYETIRGAWLVELAELDSLNRSESSSAKAFFSGKRDKYRKAYGRNPERVARQCVFCGTVNPSYYLKDESGNQRYWPVHCDRLSLYGEDSLTSVRDQLWAEAMVYYRRGLRWWPTEREWELINEEIAQREVGDAWQDRIRQYLDNPPDQIPLDRVTMDDLLSRALSLDAGKWTKNEQVRVGNIMARMGWSRHRGTGGGWFYRRPRKLEAKVVRIGVGGRLGG